ncbi:hypothetical protein K2173_025571 [Erythroxylum novogranatense]|uniref:Patatin n=1 Tax=Erythroxylum novogranatense TaxID=1862640 RepID=A0AAV8TA56_9ROSI|nr:hypothetical protein K2173_025571 [Erythroxylum novogranatense]
MFIPPVFTLFFLPYAFNLQYPAGTCESPTIGASVGHTRCPSIGSFKHHVWQAIRASSAAPYYLDDFLDGINRCQDGAIVANNPTIFAIREAQLLWPDTKIDYLVSIGCGSVPTKEMEKLLREEN